MTKEPVELELVSTIVLDKILGSADGKTRDEISRLAKGRKDGVLAWDTATGVFKIVSHDDARKRVHRGIERSVPGQAAVTQNPATKKGQQSTDELSLVSTQVLRKVLNLEEPAEKEKPAVGTVKKDKYGGFDPYNNS